MKNHYNIGKNNPMFKHHYSSKTIEKMSKCKKGENNPNYKHGNTNKITNCIDCDKKLSLYNYKRCKSCARKSRNLQPNWQNGKTNLSNLIYSSKYNKIWRNNIYIRDNYTCQNCKKRGFSLHAHHILVLSCILDLYEMKTFNDALKCKLLWDINWGITLCETCHKKI